MQSRFDVQAVETTVLRVAQGAEGTFVRAANIGIAAFERDKHILGARLDRMPGEGSQYTLMLTRYAKDGEYRSLTHAPSFHRFCASVEEYLASEPEIISTVVTKFPRDDAPARSFLTNIKIESLMWEATNSTW